MFFSTMRTVKHLHTAIYGVMDGLVTYNALPYEDDYARFDPFLVLNHHGVQYFQPGNAGLPFGPHPHRGIETLTFIFQGDLTHRDSTGGDSVIQAGGVQWMTAGRGIVHEEVSSEEFKKNGGTLDIIQVWFNLPGSMKMIKPGYTGLQRNQLPEVPVNGTSSLRPVSGNWAGRKGPLNPVSGISIASLDLKQRASYAASVPADETVLLYVVHGIIRVNGRKAEIHTLVEFANDSEAVEIEALEDSLLIFGHGRPTREPIVARGPFVMNSEEEIEQAYADYRAGLFKG